MKEAGKHREGEKKRKRERERDKARVKGRIWGYKD